MARNQLKQNTPDLGEFIDLSERRRKSRMAHGYQAMHGRATVAVYNSRRHGKTYQILTIRISDDLAQRHNLAEGARMTCLVHPDQQYLALTPGRDGHGAVLFRARHGQALTFQTTLKGGTLEPQPATHATLFERDGALIVAITPD